MRCGGSVVEDTWLQALRSRNNRLLIIIIKLYFQATAP